MFRKLCGTTSLSAVVLVTTYWDVVHDQELATRREDELKTNDDFWGLMIKHGSSVQRHTGDRDLAMRILETLVHRDARITLDIQAEMVDQGKELSETSAGKMINQLLAEYKTVVDNPPALIQL